MAEADNKTVLARIEKLMAIFKSELVDAGCVAEIAAEREGRA
jgi:hypothetical protein